MRLKEFSAIIEDIISQAEITMIAVIGDIMVDVVVEVDKYPREGGEAICEKTSIRLGGSACNTAVLLTKLYPDTFLFSQVGDDYYGMIASSKIEKSGLKTEHILRKKMNMGYMMIVLSESGQRTMFSSRIREPIPASTEYYENNLTNCDLIHISGYLLQENNQWNVVKHVVDFAMKNEIMISVDPGTSTVKHFKNRLLKLLEHTDIFLPNEYEIALLTGECDTELALESVSSFTEASVIVKCGSDGCKYRQDNEIISVKALCSEEIKSTVGAGDAFNAGFLNSFIRGYGLNRSCECGNEIAVKLITQCDEIMNINI